MNSFSFTAENEDDTRRFGAALAAALPDGATVALCGTLGAGKTRLVQAVAAACGVNRSEVVSPTFVLCREYHGERTIYHLDAYRIRDEDEFMELGPEEFFESDGITLVEWADRVIDCLPCERVEVHIEVTGRTARRFEVRAVGRRYRAVADEIARRLESE